MSVFTELHLRLLDETQWLVTSAHPWWLPNYRHETHFIPNPKTGRDATGVLFLRLPFYDPKRPRLDEIITLSDFLP